MAQESANLAPLVRVACPLCGSHEGRYEREVNRFRLEQCTRCRFVFVNPQWTAEAIDEQYASREEPQSLLAHYRRVHTADKLQEYDDILRRILHHRPPGRRLLDVGCGPGYFLKRSSQSGFDAHGIDLAPWSLQAARDMGVENVQIGRLERLGFSDASFDIVHAAQVLEHLKNPRRELAQMRRILKPRGLLYINVPNYRCCSILLGRDDFVLNEPMAHLNYFTPRSLAAMLRIEGFEVLEVSTFGGIKWENLIGRPYVSEEVKSLRDLNHPRGTNSPGDFDVQPPPANRDPFLKRVIRPVAKQILYRWGKLALTLEAFARKPC